MILSMTGFGEARLEEDGQSYYLELRSVNNRYFKAAIRLPEEFGFLETEIERLLRQRMTRGSVSVRVSLRDLSASAASDINVAAILHYVSQLRKVAAAEPGFMTDLAVLATLPGVCQPHEMTDQQREHGVSIVLELIKQAMDRLIAMRTAEGRKLAEDLRAHCRSIREHLEAIRARAPLVVAEYRVRLASRVQELIADATVRLAEEDLLKEVAIYAERSDISEELSRLTSHLDQFDAGVSSSEPAGRKLDFIAQEMLREANTIGSKAGDAEIARHTIEIKSAIDRLKEQVQNVE